MLKKLALSCVLLTALCAPAVVLNVTKIRGVGTLPSTCAPATATQSGDVVIYSNQLRVCGADGISWGSAGAGADGAKWFSAAGAPSSGTGANGDYYLNLTTSDVYGPKAAGAWGSIVLNIKGATGTNGTNGSNGNTVLSGTSAPSGGVDGDFYIKTDTKVIYGPKAAGSWPGSGTSLIGPTGTTGATGATGTNGTNGNTLLNGTSAPSGGANGDYYLKTDTNCLYGPKASGVWPGSCTSLVGPTGATGATGAAGAGIGPGSPFAAGAPGAPPTLAAGEGGFGLRADGEFVLRRVESGTTYSEQLPVLRRGSACPTGQHEDGGYDSHGVPTCTVDSGGAPLASPAFTGVPTAPTAAASTNNTQLATTAYADAAVAAGISGGLGWPTAPVTTHDNDTATYNNDVTVTVAGCSGGTKYYSVDQSTVAAVSGTISITATGTILDSRCEKTGYEKSIRKRSTYTLTVATPTQTPDTSTVTSGTTVTIATTTTGSPVLKYCTNTGSDCDPTSGTTYTTAVALTIDQTHLCSKGSKTGYNASATKCSTYTVGAGTPIGMVTGQHVESCGQDSGTTLTLPSPATVGNVLVFGGVAYNTLTGLSATTTGGATTAFTIDGAEWAPGDRYKFQRYTVTTSGITGATIVGGGDYNCRFLVELHNADTGTVDKIDVTGASGAVDPWVGHTLTPTTGKSTLILSITFGLFTPKTCNTGFNDIALASNVGTTAYGSFCGKYVTTPTTGYHLEGLNAGGGTSATFSEALKGQN